MSAKRKLPSSLLKHVDGYRWRRIEIGESGADVYRLTAKGRPPLFLKHVADNTVLGLREEAERLHWLADHASAPHVVGTAYNGGQEWLLMTALAGVNAEAAHTSPAAKVKIIGEALRALHAIDANDCPFDESLDIKISRAADNVRHGRVEESHFDARNIGRKATDLFSEMLSKRPAREDLVVTHGDACFANFMIDADTFSGFVDCARVGRADRYQDLALACRSIEGDLGVQWIAPFLCHYGLDRADPDRLAFYRLLDEFS